jgi:hypothetical protein
MYSYYDSDIEYELRINHAGRNRIVESSAGARRHSSDDGRSFFPESLWPAVLARAYENSYQIYYEEFSDDRRNYYTYDFKSKNKSADGVFDLFRRGLAGSLSYSSRGNDGNNGGGNGINNYDKAAHSNSGGSGGDNIIDTTKTSFKTKKMKTQFKHLKQTKSG